VAAIITGNVATAGWPPITIGPLIIPIGAFLIGVVFLLRDFVQMYSGKKTTYYIILVAMFLSGLCSYILGDTLWIVFASTVTFAVSESMDTEMFSRLKLSFNRRVIYSGITGGVLDSALFVIIGLSPLGADILPWTAVSYAIIGQILVKVLIQIILLLIIRMLASRPMIIKNK